MNKMTDRQFDRLLEEALRLDFDSDLANTSTSPFNPSPDFENKMAELFRKENEKKFKLRSVLKKVAVFFLVSASILGIFLGTNTQARERIYSWIIEDFGLYSSFTAEKPSIDEESLSLDDLKINYIPEGFDLVEVQEGRTIKIFHYMNDKNLEIYIKINEIIPDNNKIDLNTQGANLEEIFIGSSNGYYWNLKDNSYLFWRQNNIECLVSGNISRDEIIKIGENISE